jgi:FlaA1/EpsC-like NDP-sugar epimerase
MQTMASDLNWNRLLPSRPFTTSIESLVESQSGKVVLLTGAAGCIGAALAKTLLRGRPRFVVLLDHSERALYEFVNELASLPQTATYRAILGDVRDEVLLLSLMREYRPDLILHAAAFKHVPLMEENPFAAVGNNALATWQLLRVAADFRVPRFLLISTDKAANPRGIMGASKRLAELAVSRWSEGRRDYRAIRLGNVIGSQGSVVPLFLEQIARGGPVTVTDPEVTRFFLTLGGTVQLILSAASLEGTCGLLLPELGEPIKIAELARYLIQQSGAMGSGNGDAPKIEIQFTGLRPGDKLSEDLVSIGETLHPTSDPQIQCVSGCVPPPAVLEKTFARLKETLEARDLATMLEAVHELAPEYAPSETLLRLASEHTPTAGTNE